MTTTTDLLRRAAEMLRKLDHEEIEASDDAASLLALADQMERAEPVGTLRTCVWNGRTWTVSLHVPTQMRVGDPLYTHPAPEVPEGCTPADARMLRAANHAFAQEKHELIDLLREFAPDGEIACDECGGDDAECPSNCMVRRARARIKDYDNPAPEVTRDAERLNWLESMAHSRSGISADYAKYAEDGIVQERGYRVGWWHHIGERFKTLREAIDAAMQEPKP